MDDQTSSKTAISTDKNINDTVPAVNRFIITQPKALSGFLFYPGPRVANQ